MKLVSLFLLSALMLIAQNPNTAVFPAALATDTTLLVGVNRSASTLTSGIDNATLDIPVADGTAFLEEELITIDDEQMLIDSIVGNTLTVVARGFSTTDPAAHLINALVRGQITAWHHNQLAAEMIAIQTSLGIGLGNVSPVAGSTSIVTVGTIGTGVWNGTVVDEDYLDLAWGSAKHLTWNADVGIRRLGVGELGISDTSTGNGNLTLGTLRLGGTAATDVKVNASTSSMHVRKGDDNDYGGAYVKNFTVISSLAAQQVGATFYEQAVAKWFLGKNTDNSFQIYDNANTTNRMVISAAGEISLIPVSLLTITGAASVTPSWAANRVLATGATSQPTSGYIPKWDVSGRIVEGVAAPTGAIVGTTDTQELTNKTINSITNYIHADATHTTVRNESGGELAKGTPVYISGYNAGLDLVLVSPAKADSAATLPSIGLLESVLANNATGVALAIGTLSGMKTNEDGWAVGDKLYVSTATAGALTKVRPTGATNFVQRVGIILRVNATAGVIEVVGSHRANSLPLDIDAALIGSNAVSDTEFDYLDGVTSGIQGQLNAKEPTITADSIDAITEIASALKTGSDVTLVTGTKGATDDCAKWNVDGDLVSTGAACGSGTPGGTDGQIQINDSGSFGGRGVGSGLVMDASNLKVDDTIYTRKAETESISGAWTHTNDLAVSGASADVDLTGANTTKPMKSGTTAPATCAVGEMFYDTDASAGLNVFGCTAVDTWTLQGDGGGAPAEDSVGTSGLDDGSDTPASGEYVRVDTVDQAGFEYRSVAEVLSDIGAAPITHSHAVAVELVVFDFATDTATGDGKYYFVIPSKLNGWNLTAVSAQVISVGTTGTLNVDLARCDVAATGNACSGTVQDMLSTNLTIDSNEGKSSTAEAAAAIDTDYDDVDTDEIIRVDVDAVHTTAAKGLILNLKFEKP